MSQYKAKGVNPKNGREVSVLFGYDQVPGFKGGWFFQVYLLKSDPDWRDDSENCIVNKGFLNGISKEELNTLHKEWSVTMKRPINQGSWITV